MPEGSWKLIQDLSAPLRMAAYCVHGTFIERTRLLRAAPLMSPMHNLIEPTGLLQHFLAHPPAGFQARQLSSSTPVFSAQFDLLTTMEVRERQKLEALPWSRYWRRWLVVRACFVGTTCTEYATLPDIPAPDFLHCLLEYALPEHSFVIIKDIPVADTLVGTSAVNHAQQLLQACQQHGFVVVEGQALAYVAIDFPDLEAYLCRLSRARRKDLRRKLRALEELHVETINTGDARFFDEAVLQHYYALYLAVYRQSEIHFDRLTPDFFRAVLQDATLNGVIFAYHVRRTGELIGYNLCFVHRGMLLDKYVGFRYPQARQYNLYMVSWVHNLEYALAHRLTHYVAGWTDPEIKRHLGASFTMTRHAVYIRNPLLRFLLRPFRRFFESDAKWHAQTH